MGGKFLYSYGRSMKVSRFTLWLFSSGSATWAGVSVPSLLMKPATMKLAGRSVCSITIITIVILLKSTKRWTLAKLTSRRRREMMTNEYYKGLYHTSSSLGKENRTWEARQKKHMIRKTRQWGSNEWKEQRGNTQVNDSRSDEYARQAKLIKLKTVMRCAADATT